jgi:hypothetical protein
MLSELYLLNIKVNTIRVIPYWYILYYMLDPIVKEQCADDVFYPEPL